MSSRVTTKKGRQKIDGPIVVVRGGSFRLAPALDAASGMCNRSVVLSDKQILS